jgi:LmbE family N-acetylglucosaminyl deacetylase
MESQHARIMVVGAHPADPFERAGGTVARHLARGDVAMLVSLTSGVVTHAFTSFPATGKDKLRALDAVVATKRDEFERAARMLGVQEWRLLDLPESPMHFDLEAYVIMVDLIREFRPHALICQHPVEVGRHDHMDAGRFALAAADYARAEGFPSELAPHAVPHPFMSYYQDFPTEQLMGGPRHAPEVIVDISDVIDIKREAMLQFGTTQAREGEDYRRRLDRFFERVDGAAGYLHGFEYAERFTRWHPERVQYLPLGD